MVKMKKLLLACIALALVSGAVAASCINAKHIKTQPTMVNGKTVYKNTYKCHIRGEDTGSFDANRACKRCGCSQVDHDNRIGGH
jgi:hypothetical protein